MNQACGGHDNGLCWNDSPDSLGRLSKICMYFTHLFSRILKKARFTLPGYPEYYLEVNL